MVETQLVRRGIQSERVLAAIESVPREWFVSTAAQAQAYADRAVAIDCGQTISQPYIVALMTTALELAEHHRVLEIGTGSGYQAAVLSQLAREVITIERHPALAQAAERRLAKLGATNVRVILGDGTQGFAAAAPYDRIIITAATGEVPAAVFSQLVEGGILVAPLGDSQSQVLQSIRKIGGQTNATRLTDCRFVPLVEGPAEEG